MDDRRSSACRLRLTLRRLRAQGSWTRAARDVNAALAIHAALGVETVVRKTREVYLVDGARIHLDRVAGLGTFVEIEVLMERAGRRSARLMRDLCERLRLPKTTAGIGRGRFANA